MRYLAIGTQTGIGTTSVPASSCGSSTPIATVYLSTAFFDAEGLATETTGGETGGSKMDYQP